MVHFTNSNYYSAMDRFGGGDVIEPLTAPNEQAADEVLSLGTADFGMATNPMGNAIVSVKERIMQGAGKIEFEFMGAGKSNSQQPSPEVYGSVERKDLKELLTINDIKSSVHAAVHAQSLAGFGQNGFSGQQREAAIKEINRAIDFAGDVTKGGAIVFHVHEWQRPLTQAGQVATNRKEGQWMFRGYQEEDRDSQMLVVDSRTGKFISDVTKDTEVFEPDYETVGEKHPELVGTIDKNTNKRIRADDYISLNGGVIHKDATVEELFDRVPKWQEDKTSFKIRKLEWEDFVRMSQEHNQEHPDDLKTPEYFFARTKIENTVSQARGTSLYHARQYEGELKRYNKLKQAYELAKQIEEGTPENERWRLNERMSVGGSFGEYMVPDNMSPTEYFKDAVKMAEDTLRHIHESSASADAQAQERIELIKHLKSAEEYGLSKTAETIARVGMNALETTRAKGLEKPLYAAPENWNQNYYGSHPDELRRIVEESRKTMAHMLKEQKYTHSDEEAKKLANDHIKATFDIGHANVWRQHFNPVDEKGDPIYRTVEERHKAFDKWMLDESEKLVKDGIVGHIHLSDNFGFDDEHVTPGQGNVPMKEFLKRMEKAGMRDFVVEPGGFNTHTAAHEAMALVGSPVYGVGRANPFLPRFNQMHQRHFGYAAPPFFSGGAYVPSNDWRPWTEVPLE